MDRILFGVFIGIVLVPLVVVGWLRYGHPPVAVTDAPLPFERQIVDVPMHARIDRELVKTPPIQPDEAVLVAGAQIQHEQCAACHCLRGKPVSFAARMFPRAPSLMEKHRNGNAVGVSDDSPGETYRKVANGIRLSGMPAYKRTLSDSRIWQVTLLLANADKPMPPAALAFLKPETPPPSMPPPTAQQK